MRRVSELIAVPLLLMSALPSCSQPVCRPTLAFTDAHYTPMQLPKLERAWTIAFTVDASACATDFGKLLNRVHRLEGECT